VGAAAALAVIAGGTLSARAGSHLWRFNEIFTNEDGTVQFIELLECCGSTFENSLLNKWVRSEANGGEYTFPANIPGNTANRYLLLATVDFAALPGAPTPDYIIPAGLIPVNGGNTLRYFVYSEAVMTYGAGALPTDGVTSLRIDGTTGANTPTNYNWDEGSVIAGTCTDSDSDGYGSPGSPACPNGAAMDCNDGNPAVHPGATEACFDQVDNDCDAAVDCDDTSCASLLACIPTLSHWGVVVMALSMLTGGTLVMRKRSPA
jgi:hypothetical protein